MLRDIERYAFNIEFVFWHFNYWYIYQIYSSGSGSNVSDCFHRKRDRKQMTEDHFHYRRQNEGKTLNYGIANILAALGIRKRVLIMFRAQLIKLTQSISKWIYRNAFFHMAWNAIGTSLERKRAEIAMLLGKEAGPGGTRYR